MERTLNNYVCEERLFNNKNYENTIIATRKYKIFNHFCGLRGNNRKNIYNNILLLYIIENIYIYMEPYLKPNDKSLFYNLLDNCNYYLEYGSGGSTYQASLRENIEKYIL